MEPLLDPYAAPAAPLLNPGAAPVSAGRRSRWAVLRWVPLVYCAICGVMFAAMTLVELGMLVYFCGINGYRLTATDLPRIWILIVLPVQWGIVALSYRVVRSWYRSRFRRALWETVALLLATIVFAYGSVLVQG